MIFYFSGTGNSLYAAKELLAEGEQLVDMAKANWERTITYTPAEGESVGFVLPVYFYGLPDTVRSFVRKLRFTAQPEYVYAVITCGGHIAASGELLRKALAEGGTTLHAVYNLVMPDNYVVLYDVTTPEEEVPILAAAQERLGQIRRSIGFRRSTGLDISAFERAKTAALYPLYDICRRTSKFRTNEKCVGCGVCASRCPAHAIEMQDGHPVWVKSKCDQCLACLRCNAVEYGRRTAGAYRYMHPDLRKKTAGHDHGAGGDGAGCCGGQEASCCCGDDNT